MAVVGEAANGDDATRVARLAQPDVVILDVLLRGESGIDALARIREAAPATKVLVLLMDDDPLYVRAAFAAGANGYLVKQTAHVGLIQAVRQLVAGGPFG